MEANPSPNVGARKPFGHLIDCRSVFVVHFSVARILAHFFQRNRVTPKNSCRGHGERDLKKRHKLNARVSSSGLIRCG